MKANIILKALIKNDVNLECCGTVRVYEDDNLNFGQFVRRFFDPEFSDPTLSAFPTRVPSGEWFYCWHPEDIIFGIGETLTILRIEGQSLHIMLLDEE